LQREYRASDGGDGEGCQVSNYVEREYPRYALRADLSATFRGEPITGQTINVSRGGLCALMAQPLPIGADLNISLVLCFEDGALSEPLSLWSRIVWCTALNEQFQVGLAFVNVDAATKNNLEMFLRFLDQREGADADRR
jgi:PilZ domain